MLIDVKQIIGSGVSDPEVYKDCDLNNSILHGVNCTRCNNTGHIVSMRDGHLYSAECICMEMRRSLLYMRRSGLEDMVKHYTFDNFKTPNAELAGIKAAGYTYVSLEDGRWFFVKGARGSGKTHICTAIAKEILEKGKSLKYVLWRDLTQQLKSAINDPYYQALMDDIRKVDVLYIDDFLKGTVTEPDVNRAYEVINARYNFRKKKTIISTERSLEEIDRMDSAISDRIRERSRGYCFSLNEINWRKPCYSKTASGMAPSTVAR